MDSCLLCLGITNDKLDIISVNSTQWQKLDITSILVKHFWSLNTINSNSWICLSCWEKVEDFHNFYMCIEEAHNNLSVMKEIKLEEEQDEEIELEEQKFANKYNKQVITYDDEDDVEEEVEEEELKEEEQEELKEEEQEELKEECLEEQVKLESVEMEYNDSNLLELNEHTKYDNNMEDTNMHENDYDNDDDIDEIYEEFFEDLNNLEEELENAECSEMDDVKEEILNENNKNMKLENFQSKNLAEIETVLVVQDDVDNISINSEIEHSYNNQEDDNTTNNNITKNNDINKDNSNVKSKKKEKYIYFTEYMKTESLKSNQEKDEFIAKNFKPLECDLCNKPLENILDVQKHFQTEHQQKGYVYCCNRKHYTRTSLTEHIHRHLNPNFFKCPRCDLVLSDRFNLKYHIMRVHEPDKSYFKHRCNQCGKVYQTAKRLEAHNLTHAPVIEKNFHCKICKKSYATSDSLKNHIDIIHLKKKTKICPVCGKTCNTPSDYSTHMRIHEVSPSTAVNCDECGVRVKSQHHLKLHKKAQHPAEGKQDAPCPVCGKMYRKGRSLRSHILYIHKKTNNYKCSYCEKSFNRRDALKEHTATHTGTPLYLCPWCPKTFNSHSNMRVHRRKIHPVEHEEAELKKLNGLETDEESKSFKLEIDIM